MNLKHSLIILQTIIIGYNCQVFGAEDQKSVNNLDDSTIFMTSPNMFFNNETQSDNNPTTLEGEKESQDDNTINNLDYENTNILDYIINGINDTDFNNSMISMAEESNINYVNNKEFNDQVNDSSCFLNEMDRMGSNENNYKEEKTEQKSNSWKLLEIMDTKNKKQNKTGEKTKNIQASNNNQIKKVSQNINNSNNQNSKENISNKGIKEDKIQNANIIQTNDNYKWQKTEQETKQKSNLWKLLETMKPKNKEQSKKNKTQNAKYSNNNQIEKAKQNINNSNNRSINVMGNTKNSISSKSTDEMKKEIKQKDDNKEQLQQKKKKDKIGYENFMTVSQSNRQTKKMRKREEKKIKEEEKKIKEEEKNIINVNNNKLNVINEKNKGDEKDEQGGNINKISNIEEARKNTGSNNTKKKKTKNKNKDKNNNNLSNEAFDALIDNALREDLEKEELITKLRNQKDSIIYTSNRYNTVLHKYSVSENQYKKTMEANYNNLKKLLITIEKFTKKDPTINCNTIICMIKNIIDIQNYNKEIYANKKLLQESILEINVFFAYINIDKYKDYDNMILSKIFFTDNIFDSINKMDCDNNLKEKLQSIFSNLEEKYKNVINYNSQITNIIWNNSLLKINNNSNFDEKVQKSKIPSDGQKIFIENYTKYLLPRIFFFDAFCKRCDKRIRECKDNENNMKKGYKNVQQSLFDIYESLCSQLKTIILNKDNTFGEYFKKIIAQHNDVVKVLINNVDYVTRDYKTTINEFCNEFTIKFEKNLLSDFIEEAMKTNKESYDTMFNDYFKNFLYIKKNSQKTH